MSFPKLMGAATEWNMGCGEQIRAGFVARCEVMKRDLDSFSNNVPRWQIKGATRWMLEKVAGLKQARGKIFLKIPRTRFKRTPPMANGSSNHMERSGCHGLIRVQMGTDYEAWFSSHCSVPKRPLCLGG